MSFSGPIEAGSWYATFQSAAMGGFGTAVLDFITTIAAGILATVLALVVALFRGIFEGGQAAVGRMIPGYVVVAFVSWRRY